MSTVERRALVGQIVRDARIERAIGLRELARETGCAPTTICDIEHGRKRPGPDLVVRLADRLRLDEADRAALIEGTGLAPGAWIATLARPAVVRLVRMICETAIDDADVDDICEGLAKGERGRHARVVQARRGEDRDR